MIILGIDCGLDGALTWLSDLPRDGAFIIDMPTFVVSRGGKKRRDLDGQSLVRAIEERPPDHAFIEQAQGMPKQSAYATGIFFQNYGEVRGILIGKRIPFTVVHPSKWKRALAVPAEKDGARARASQLMPAYADQWPLKKHDGRAESCLIAYWGLRSLTNEQSPVEAPSPTPRRGTPYVVPSKQGVLL